MRTPMKAPNLLRHASLLTAFALLVVFAVARVAFAADTTRSEAPAPSLTETWRAEAERAAAGLDVIRENTNVGPLNRLGQGVLVRGQVDGSVNIVRGDLFVLGRVRGPVSVVSGDVTVLGEIDGSVSVVGGNLRIAGNITGPTSVVGGRIQRASSDSAPTLTAPAVPAQPDPPAASTTTSRKVFHFDLSRNTDNDGSSADDDLTTGEWLLLSVLFGAVLLVCWLGTSLLTTVLFPTAVTRAANLLSAQPAKVFAVGIAFWFAFGLALLVAVLLSGVLIGIPMIGLLLLGVLVLRWFGLAAVFLWIGRALGRRFGHPDHSPYLSVFIGAAATALLHMIPVLGLVLWCVLAIPVAGVAALSFAETRRPAPATPSDLS